MSNPIPERYACTPTNLNFNNNNHSFVPVRCRCIQSRHLLPGAPYPSSSYHPYRHYPLQPLLLRGHHPAQQQDQRQQELLSRDPAVIAPFRLHHRHVQLLPQSPRVPFIPTAPAVPATPSSIPGTPPVPGMPSSILGMPPSLPPGLPPSMPRLSSPVPLLPTSVSVMPPTVSPYMQPVLRPPVRVLPPSIPPPSGPMSHTHAPPSSVPVPANRNDLQVYRHNSANEQVSPSIANNSRRRAVKLEHLLTTNCSASVVPPANTSDSLCQPVKQRLDHRSYDMLPHSPSPSPIKGVDSSSSSSSPHLGELLISIEENIAVIANTPDVVPHDAIVIMDDVDANIEITIDEEGNTHTAAIKEEDNMDTGGEDIKVIIEACSIVDVETVEDGCNDKGNIVGDGTALDGDDNTAAPTNNEEPDITENKGNEALEDAVIHEDSLSEGSYDVELLCSVPMEESGSDILASTIDYTDVLSIEVLMSSQDAVARQSVEGIMKTDLDSSMVVVSANNALPFSEFDTGNTLPPLPDLEYVPPSPTEDSPLLLESPQLEDSSLPPDSSCSTAGDSPSFLGSSVPPANSPPPLVFVPSPSVTSDANSEPSSKPSSCDANCYTHQDGKRVGLPLSLPISIPLSLVKVPNTADALTVDPRPPSLIVSIPLEVLNRRTKPSTSESQMEANTAEQQTSDDESSEEKALMVLEKIFKQSNLLSEKDTKIIKNFLKGGIMEQCSSCNGGIRRYALSRVTRNENSVCYASIELDEVNRKWRGVMIDATDVGSLTFHNEFFQ